MEEDINILEHLKNDFIKLINKKDEYVIERDKREKEARAIENLIKGYRELEERNKYLVQYRQALEEDLFENCSNYVISKDKIRKYKEKFIKDKETEKSFMTQSGQINASLISFCDELLKEE